MEYQGRAPGPMSFDRPSKRRGGAAAEAEAAQRKRQRQVEEMQELLGTKPKRREDDDEEEEGDEGEVDDYDVAMLETDELRGARRRGLRDVDDDSDEEDERAAAKKKPPKAGKKLRPQDIAGQEVTTVLEEDGNRIEPFNMNEELEEGSFDENGFYTRKKSATFRDAWLESVTVDDIKKAQQAVAKQKAKEEAEETLDRTPANRLRLLRTVVDLLQENETPMMGLKRLGGQKTSAGHRGKAEAAAPEDTDAAKEKKRQFDALTEACDQLMAMGEYGIYQEPRERLATQLPAPTEDAGSADAVPEVQWRYKWTADGEVYGPFSSEQMAAWAEQNLFGPDGVLVQKVERGKEPAGFYPSKRVDFSLYID